VTDAPTQRDSPAGSSLAGPRQLVRVVFPAPAPAASAPAIALDGVALVTLDRPEALNALSFDLLDALAAELESLDADPAARVVVITGAGGRAFAAGADIRELAPQTSASLRDAGRFRVWNRLAAIGLPLIAAVRGVALGGGCELAMICDMVVAADDATFGQPEIRLGVMPGAGGTQRLTRAIGKAKAMELILTGRSIGAIEAEALGLVTTVVPAETTVDAALQLAARIAALPPLGVRAAVAAVRDADERTLGEGLAREREAFFRLFDTHDQAEGMAAFIEKRAPVWTGRRRATEEERNDGAGPARRE
jgi:enoyl-CoA hydratase